MVDTAAVVVAHLEAGTAAAVVGEERSSVVLDHNLVVEDRD